MPRTKAKKPTRLSPDDLPFHHKWQTDKADRCHICTESLDDPSAVDDTLGLAIPPCGHAFHRGCLLEWLDRPDTPSTCPVCRKHFHLAVFARRFLQEQHADVNELYTFTVILDGTDVTLVIVVKGSGAVEGIHVYDDIHEIDLGDNVEEFFNKLPTDEFVFSSHRNYVTHVPWLSIDNDLKLSIIKSTTPPLNLSETTILWFDGDEDIGLELVVATQTPQGDEVRMQVMTDMHRDYLDVSCSKNDRWLLSLSTSKLLSNIDPKHIVRLIRSVEFDQPDCEFINLVNIPWDDLPEWMDSTKTAIELE